MASGICQLQDMQEAANETSHIASYIVGKVVYIDSQQEEPGACLCVEFAISTAYSCLNHFHLIRVGLYTLFIRLRYTLEKTLQLHWYSSYLAPLHLAVQNTSTWPQFDWTICSRSKLNHVYHHQIEPSAFNWTDCAYLHQTRVHRYELECTWIHLTGPCLLRQTGL